MLAVLHKRALGLGHAGFAQLFPFDNSIPHGRHNEQLTFPHDHVVYGAKHFPPPPAPRLTL